MALSEEQRRAASERMKARWAEKKASQNKNPKTKETYIIENNINPQDSFPEGIPIEEPTNVPEIKEDTIVQPDVNELIKQIEELKAMQWQMMRDAMREGEKPSNVATAVSNGKLTGTVDKYSMDKMLYADPRERLAEEPKLKRFAFPLNYELEWEIGESAYETIDHIRMREPRFTLTLVKIMLDEDTGEDTNGRYDICRLIMHEDPVAAMTIAREHGLDVQADDETSFLNEMRYIRMRDWLLEAFYPSKPTVGKQKRDMVVGGKLVSYWEKNTEADSGDQGIRKTDWDNLPKVKF